MRAVPALVVVAACAGRAPERAPATGHIVEDAWPAPPRANFPRLPRGFMPTGYRLGLAVGAQLAGRVEIDGTLARPTSRIWLHVHDETIRRATIACGGATMPLAEARTSWPGEPDELLALDAATPLGAGACTIAIDYTADLGDAPEGAFRERAGYDSYVYTALQPTYARRVVPCLDEPDVQVPWTLSLTVRAGLVAVSNAPVARAVELGNGWRRVDFEPTPPLASDLVAFAVGPFDVAATATTASGVDVRVLAPRGDRAVRDAAVVAREITFEERWLGVAFPYRKLDVVVVPETGERWTATTSPGLVAVAQQITTDSWPATTARAVAMHWFGDLVTPAWWDDTWLAASLADWAGANAVAAVAPGAKPLAFELGAIRPAADDANRPVRLSQAVLGGGRGARLLRWIEQQIGADTMQRGVHDYLTKHAYAAATTGDLLDAIVPAATGAATRAAITERLAEPDAPTVRITTTCGTDGATAHVAVSARDLPVCLAWGTDTTREDRCVVATDAADVPMGACPTWTIGDARGEGMYRVAAEPGAARAALVHGWAQLAPVERDQLLAALASDPAEQLAAVPALVAADDSAALLAAARTLVEDATLCPDGLRPAFDAWVEHHLGATARDALAEQTAHDPLDSIAGQARGEAALADAIAGDPQLIAAAAPKLRTAYRQSPLLLPAIALAAARTPGADLGPHAAFDLAQWSGALGPYLMRGLVAYDGIIDLIADLSADADPDYAVRVFVLMSQTCDPRIVPLADVFGGDIAYLTSQRMATCSARRAALEPVFRSWLAP
jgi:alanyl aminopeptidase